MGAYRRIVVSRLRSQVQYRAAFAIDCLSDMLAQATELVALLVLFTQVAAIGGFDRQQVLLMYALASTAFGLAELTVGQVGDLSWYVRSGEFDVLLMRPLSTLGQLVTSDVQLRRVGRVVVGLSTLGVVLSGSAVTWSPATVLLLVLTPLAGAAILGSVWVVAATIAFWLVDAQEATGSVTHGSNLFTSYPITVYPTVLRYLLAFVVPGAFVAYYPSLALLGRADPLGGPPWVSWAAPAVAVLAVGVTGAVWRVAVRHYQGTGS